MLTLRKKVLNNVLRRANGATAQEIASSTGINLKTVRNVLGLHVQSSAADLCMLESRVCRVTGRLSTVYSSYVEGGYVNG